MIVGSAGKVAAYFECMSEFLALWKSIHSSSYHGYDRSKGNSPLPIDTKKANSKKVAHLETPKIEIVNGKS